MRRVAILTLITLGICLTAWATWPALAVAEPISQSEIPSAAGTTTTPPSDPNLNDAVTKFQQRDFDGALASLQEAVKKNPDLPPANIIMAQLFARANMGQAARGFLERAAVDAPNDPESYLFMGEIALSDRRIAEAELLFNKANELLAKFTGSAKRKETLQPAILSGMSRINEARGNWKEAQKFLEAWLKADPKSTPALLQLARCLFQQDNVDAALAKLKEASTIDPTLLTPEARLAQFFAQAGKQGDAKTWMIKALNAAPRDLKTRLVAAQWAFETDQYDEAARQADAAMKLDPKDINAKRLAGLIALFQKDYPKAELYFDQAHRDSPTDAASANNLALALVEQNDDAKKRRALEYAELNVRQYPKSGEAYSTYGWVLYKLGQLDRAEQSLRQAISVAGGSLSPDTAYFLARVLADRGGGRDADARQLLEGALKSTSPFSQRAEAKELLEKLNKAAAATEKPATPATPAK